MTLMAASLEDLLSLWHGDRDSAGYWSAELVVAVCEHTQPTTTAAVRDVIFPGVPLQDLPDGAASLVEEGFRIWRLRRGIARQAA